MGPEGRPIPALRCEQSNRQLGALQATDIDNYFATQATGRWSPHLGGQCGVGLARISALRGDARNVLGSPVGGGLPTKALPAGRSLPAYAPDWSDVQRMLADVDTDKPRGHPGTALILLLLAIYGMRSGEVAALRLDQD